MKRTLVFFSILALLGAALPAAADPGQAFDQIVKFQPNADLATLEPGDFATDWQTASQPAPEQPSHGGMFGKMRDAIAGAQGAMGAMQNGLAESHYIAGNRERIDYPARQSGTIVDCGARTITHLDLKAKTYYVVSMDQPQAPRGGGGDGRPGAPGPAPTDDGSKTSITIVNAAIGPKQVFGNASTGYTSDMTIVTTAANGDAHTAKMNRKEYVSRSPRLYLDCSAGRTQSGGMMGGLNRYNEMLRMMRNHGDPRFTVSATGPALPETLAYFEALSMAGENSGDDRRGGRGGSFGYIVERNNIRSIGSNDSSLSVPADFTKVDAPSAPSY